MLKPHHALSFKKTNTFSLIWLLMWSQKKRKWRLMFLSISHDEHFNFDFSIIYAPLARSSTPPGKWIDPIYTTDWWLSHSLSHHSTYFSITLLSCYLVNGLRYKINSSFILLHHFLGNHTYFYITQSGILCCGRSVTDILDIGTW